MKTRWKKVADIGWMIATLLLIPLVLVSGAQAQKYANYRVDGQKLTDQERYVLAQTEKGEVADLLEKFGPSLIPEKDRREHGLRIRARFLETLLIEGFPGFKIHRRGVRINHALLEEPLDLEGAEVDQTFWLANSILRGETNFRSSYFKRDLLLNGVQFIGAADFYRVKVGKTIFLAEAKFQGPINFVSADVSWQLIADGAQFLNEKAEATFNSMKVGNSAHFKQAIFQGPVNFGAAEIKSNFKADEAAFLNRGRNTFESIKIGQYALFRGVILNGDIVFTNGNFLDLIIQGRAPTGEKAPEENRGILRLNLEGTTVKRNLKIENVKIGELEANHCQVKGAATFQELEITRSADFQNGNFQILKFINIKNFPQKESFRLDGLTYGAICVDEPGEYQKVIELVDRSRFNPQNYLQLESFFIRIGHEQWAYRAFIGMKDQELAGKAWWNPGRWLVKIFWGGLAGYGRALFRVFWISLLMVVLGAVLFDPKYLEKGKRPPSGNKYRSALARFLLSLDQFLPAVDLGLAKDWHAAANPFYIWAYFAFLQISGYILVPLGLAAIYTQIK